MQGNQQKMREALEFASRVLTKWRQDAPFSAWNEYGEAIDGCRTALSTPPRQCDIGTAEEQAERYGRYCDKFIGDGMHCESCPCCGKIPFGKCEFAWAQMPYRE